MHVLVTGGAGLVRPCRRHRTDLDARRFEHGCPQCGADVVAEAVDEDDLFTLGKLVPILSAVHPLDEVGEATRTVQCNDHIGKIGVLCLAPSTGLGVTDPMLRADR